ncbi:MAG: hypothetical protein ACE362_03730 [Phaeodactylibacter xiamenensis]|uniref:Lipoprotein n=1 Tax=Phaeodactylibacter xiamenensis TaxID=1524460 RepID=A0A098S1A5_9BACT|nr:hypothetical protein [Phaeodactylibacter xiamenensis]KGE86159.1 hypothetical protein IX84_23825 [Phaeodactylibacter xiamenensis]MCR9052138.1 hypothetical protein [bacterium]
MKRALAGIIFSFGLWALSWLGGCASDPPQRQSFEDCLYGAPEPIFDASLPGVSQHRFELQPGKGVERFVLNQSTIVQIEQTGCDQIRQEFTFSWDAAARREDWAAQAIQKYRELGELGAPYLSFSAISEVLQARKEKLRPRGEAISLQPGLAFRITAAETGQQSKLVTVLYETAPEEE